MVSKNSPDVSSKRREEKEESRAFSGMESLGTDNIHCDLRGQRSLCEAGVRVVKF